jgi:hypothetical protein
LNFGTLGLRQGIVEIQTHQTFTTKILELPKAGKREKQLKDDKRH